MDVKPQELLPVLYDLKGSLQNFRVNHLFRRMQSGMPIESYEYNGMFSNVFKTIGLSVISENDREKIFIY